MARKRHISAVEPEAPETAQPAPTEDALASEWEAESDAVFDDGAFDETPSARRLRDWILPAVAGLALTGWTAFFVWVNQRAMLAGAPPAQWSEWITAWAAPALLVLALWLIALRSSRREALRAHEAARALSYEAALLEERLVGLNRELSLAREFVAAESRDLEALGRIAVERISASAERLAELVKDNGAQIETIAAVGGTALENMDKLRGELPVIANSARDVANNIGNAGRTAREQLDEMVAAFNRLNEFGQASDQQVEALRTRLAEAITHLSSEAGKVDEFAADLDTRLELRRRQQLEQAESLTERGEALAERLGELGGEIERIGALGGEVDERLRQSAAELSASVEDSRATVALTGEAIAGVTDSGVRLLELIRGAAQHSSESLPEAIGIAEGRLSGLDDRTRALGEVLAEAAERGEALASHVATARDAGTAGAEELEKMRASLAELDERGGELAKKAQDELRGALKALEDAARGALGSLQQEQAETISAIAERIGTESAEAISAALNTRAAEAIGEVEKAAAHASGVSREAAGQLRDQLVRVNELTGNLEQRIARARERAEQQVDNDFARRMALIAESLNSNAIDIAKAMSEEVTDTAWAAYLRGDRGIFTRRAVRLLGAPEAREIAQLYEDAPDFREHVNRYIHDFEAMLRTMLSTRDGNALAVTMLSSDMGKLYVALAQAIDRLRD